MAATRRGCDPSRVTSDIARYQRIMTHLEDWKAFITHPPAVTENSAFGIDAADGWPEVVDIAWHGVLTAVDHLLLIRDAGGTEQPPSRVLSLPTACRGALLSGCRTVWILSSSSADVRRSRALSVAVEDAQQARKAVQEMVTYFPDDATVAEAAREAVGRVDVLLERCAAARIDSSKVSDTKIIGSAAKHLSAEVAETHGALAMSWRSQSGYAHGYRWTGKAALNKPDLSEAVGAVSSAAIATNGALVLFAQHLQSPQT